jgi:3-deoxy-7-phosphoheptulonate synthase
VNNVIEEISLAGAPQQPEWGDAEQVQRVGTALAARPALVRPADVRMLRCLLSRVAAGRSLVIQSGDCAEDPTECTLEHVLRKSAVLDVLAGVLKLMTGKPVLRAGRIAGQFAKPRTTSTERIGDVDLPAFRGHMVNGPEPTLESRAPDPLRILTGYMAASEIMEHLGWRDQHRPAYEEPTVWTSHEALLLDYEMPMLRREPEGTLMLGSTHWPWIGERTRQLDGPHVAMFSRIANPVGCKVGPGMTPGELVALCDRLDPGREPGRLTLIARMGAGRVAERLPALAASVREAGHPVIWLCDPVHGNTVVTAEGHKTRVVKTLIREVREFTAAIRSAGGVAGGLHLETTPDDVTECVTDESGFAHVGDRYTSFCDPRLTLSQAIAVTSAWAG